MSSSDEEDDGRKKELVTKWRKQAAQIKSTGVRVYVLSMESWNHSGNYGRGPDTEIIGLFDSKEAAIARATVKDTDYGRFDEAIKDTFAGDGWGSTEYIDNREDGPDDDGLLLQLGGEDVGEGDYIKFLLSTMSLKGLENKKSGGTAKRASEEKTSQRRKKAQKRK